MATITSQSVDETIAVGSEFALRLRGGDVIALDGDLGAGKTHFVKGLAAGLGYSGEVTSPTFNLVHEYRGSALTLYHFDFYRLKKAAELTGIGFEEYLEDPAGVSVIEWASRFPEILPDATLRVSIESAGENSRKIDLP